MGSENNRQLTFQATKFLSNTVTSIKYLTSKSLLNLTLQIKSLPIYAFNVPILLCWHQLRSLRETLLYLCDLSLQLQWVECPSKYKKEKRQWESTVMYIAYFLFFNDQPKDLWFNFIFVWLHCASIFNLVQQFSKSYEFMLIVGRGNMKKATPRHL